MRKYSFLSLFLLLSVLLSCEEKVENPALSLLEEAKKECESGNFNNARILLDSLSATYPEAYKTRREAEIFRREVMIKEKERDVLFYTAEVERLSACRDSLATAFTFNKNSRYQDTGYYTAPSQAMSQNATTTFLRASVNEDGTAFIASFYRGRKIDHTTVKVSAQDSYVSCDKPYTSNTYREYGVYSERRDFKYGEDGGIMDFIVMSEGPFTVELTGNEGSHSYTLRDSDVQAIRSLAAFASLLRDIKQMQLLCDDAQISVEILKRNQEISASAAQEESTADE